MLKFVSRLAACGLFAGFLGLMALAPSAASAQSVNDIITRGKLVVAIDTTTPPYAFLDADLEAHRL